MVPAGTVQYNRKLPVLYCTYLVLFQADRYQYRTVPGTDTHGTSSHELVLAAWYRVTVGSTVSLLVKEMNVTS